ncbi:hypothetical protein V9T40_010756 [Parthenolecanium corni]|uniref:Uncharacterized protein n=1 Tax=Parthenolecanium corni TaxID=536013 RepID=A0AAN9XYW2_9HEMI
MQTQGPTSIWLHIGHLQIENIQQRHPAEHFDCFSDSPAYSDYVYENAIKNINAVSMFVQLSQFSSGCLNFRLDVSFFV